MTRTRRSSQAMVTSLHKRIQDRQKPGDDGFILIMLGLLIIPIMMFSALAVDVSSWYSRATELQRDADAAALAGVVWMPQITTAQARGADTLRRAGIVDGQRNISVTMEQGSAGPTSFKVCVTDERVKRFFASVFADPVSITRCGTAEYNLPLDLGSPLNFAGGYQNGFPDDPGQPYRAPSGPTPAYGPAPTPQNGDLSVKPVNYGTAVSPIDNRSHGCAWVTETNGSRVYGWYWDTSGNRWPSSTAYPSGRGRLDNKTLSPNWTTGSRLNPVTHYADELPPCSWYTPAIPYDPGQPYIPPTKTIRDDQNPGYWLAVEAPGTDAVQGDRYSPFCYGQSVDSQSSCRTTSPNPEYDSKGYYYTLTIGANNPYILIQAFDAEYRATGGQSIGTGDTQWSNSAWTTHFQILGVDATPFDPSDNPVLTSGTCGGGSGNSDNSGSWDLDSNTSYSSFVNQWRTLCTLTSPSITTNNSPYIIHVWSTSSGVSGNASNQYALRAVASTSTEVDARGYPVDALDIADQPSLAPWQRMPVSVNQTGTGNASFFLAKVESKFAGKNLVLELYDAAEGANSVTVNSPTGIQRGCSWTSAKLANVSGSSNGTAGQPIGSGSTGSTTSNCTISTSGSRYNGLVLSIKMTVPSNYLCDSTVRPVKVDTTHWQNGCWWSITYNVTDAHDNTTWSAHIEGDPVRLIQ